MSADTDTTTAVLEATSTVDAMTETPEDSAADAIAEALDAASLLADNVVESEAAEAGDSSDEFAAAGATPPDDEPATLADAFEASSAAAEETDAVLETLAQEVPAETEAEAACEPAAVLDELSATVAESESATFQEGEKASDEVAEAETMGAADSDLGTCSDTTDADMPRQQLLGRLKAISGKVNRAVARIRTLEQENHEQAQAAAQARDELTQVRAESDAFQARVKQLTIELARYHENDLANAALDEIEQNLEEVGV